MLVKIKLWCVRRAAPALQRATHKGCTMNFAVSIGPIISLVAGILILLMPRLLNYIVAIYLIVIGLIGLFGTRGLTI